MSHLGAIGVGISTLLSSKVKVNRDGHKAGIVVFFLLDLLELVVGSKSLAAWRHAV